MLFPSALSAGSSAISANFIRFRNTRFRNTTFFAITESPRGLTKVGVLEPKGMREEDNWRPDR
jgi:hypothetical protein